MAYVSFNNSSSPFFNTLKTKVEDYFKANQIKQTGNYKLYFKTFILLSFALATYIFVVFYTPSFWVSVLCCTLLGLNLAGIGFNIMHDGAHGSFSHKKWLNEAMGYSLNLMGGNMFLWKAKHNINHHSFTNIHGVDDDIDIEPWIRVHQDQKKYWYHRFQHIYWVVLYSVTYLLWVYANDFSKYFKGKVADIKFKKMSFTEHFIFWFSKVVYLFLFIVLPIMEVGWLPTLIGYAITSFVCGFVIAVVFQLAHVVEHTQFPVPDEKLKMEQEWAVHQINTTANFATKSKVVSWFTGGLNFQVEHHLFPKISHVHYPKISQLVKETCNQFNIDYIEYPTVFSALRSHVLYLKRVGAGY